VVLVVMAILVTVVSGGGSDKNRNSYSVKINGGRICIMTHSTMNFEFGIWMLENIKFKIP
jgi:hypothetical protein